MFELGRTRCHDMKLREQTAHPKNQTEQNKIVKEVRTHVIDK